MREDDIKTALDDADNSLIRLRRACNQKVSMSSGDLHQATVTWGLYRYCIGFLAGATFNGCDPVTQSRMQELKQRGEVIGKMLAQRFAASGPGKGAR